MAWTISYTGTARKQLRKLDKQTARRILDFIDARVAGSESPREVGKALTGPLLGSFWRYRVGDYRIICEIQDGKLCVLVIEIGHRKEVYR
ncbi:MAG: type II toxin-antitoxin system RelE/ParE family toxin [Rhizomicrobium sp.]|nr:type II toxin-antitoxin system RelE/ParE family toxin [Rhizomicrobium sp.]